MLRACAALMALPSLSGFVTTMGQGGVKLELPKAQLLLLGSAKVGRLLDPFAGTVEG